MRALLVASLFCALTLAGCSSSGQSTSSSVTGFEDLHASATTGVLRGVVVDDAIRPLGNVTVVIRQGDVTRNTTTGSEGRFGFDGLPPGAYSIVAKRAHYSAAQQVATVVAGIDDPAVIKVQLNFLAGQTAFYSEFKLNGFIECTTPNVNACFIADFYPCLVEHTAGQACTANATNDQSSLTLLSVMDLHRAPDWTQAELVWTPTNDLFPRLTMRLDVEKPDSSSIDAAITANGVSPLEVHANATFAAKNGLGTTDGLVFETFGGGNPTLCGAPGGCSAAATVNQEITFYVHVFYGYTPPDGWLFTTNAEVPQPPA